MSSGLELGAVFSTLILALAPRPRGVPMSPLEQHEPATQQLLAVHVVLPATPHCPRDGCPSGLSAPDLVYPHQVWFTAAAPPGSWLFGVDVPTVPWKSRPQVTRFSHNFCNIHILMLNLQYFFSSPKRTLLAMTRAQVFCLMFEVHIRFQLHLCFSEANGKYFLQQENTVVHFLIK